MATKRARGLGSARSGVEHWWAQRVTAIALVPLAVAFLIPFSKVAANGLDQVRELYGQPLQAVVAALFVGVCFHHFHLGFRVVVEDYVHHPGWKTALLTANTLGCAGLAAAGVFAVAKIALLS